MHLEHIHKDLDFGLDVSAFSPLTLSRLKLLLILFSFEIIEHVWHR